MNCPIHNVQREEIGFYIRKEEEDSIFEKLLIQELNRFVDGKKVSFWAIRDIKIKEEIRGNGSFKAFCKELNALNINLMFHDILNERFYNFFLKNGYKVFTETKYDQELISCYKTMKNDSLKLILGYKHIGIQEGVCGSRPTIIGHRIEPRHFKGMTVAQVWKSWNYLTLHQIQEALKFAESEEKKD